MIKVCSTTIIKTIPIEHGLRYFDGTVSNIELRIREEHFTVENRERVINLKKLAKKNGISIVSLHQSMKSRGIAIDISSPEKWTRNFSLRDAEMTIIAADILGVRRLVVHPSDTISQGEESDRKKIIVDSLGELTDSAEKYGIKIYVENLRNGKLGNSLKWLFSLRDQLDGKIEICFDTGHWLISRRDSDDFNNFSHYHIHDNHGKRDEHLFPGEGVFPWEKIKFPHGAFVVYELMPQENPRETISKIKEDRR